MAKGAGRSNYFDPVLAELWAAIPFPLSRGGIRDPCPDLHDAPTWPAPPVLALTAP